MEAPEQMANPDNAPLPDASSSPSGISQRCFTMDATEASVHFQIIDLGRQYYVWISATGPKLGNLCLAIQTPADAKPSVASLLASPATSPGQSLAQRLALKVKRPVLCSCNLPPNAPLLQAIAEKRLLQELANMEAVRQQSLTGAPADGLGAASNPL